MADVAALDLVIGSKVDGATSGLKTVQKGLAETAIAAGKTDSSFEKMSKTANSTKFAVQNIANVFRDLPFAINNPAIATTALDHVIGTLNMLKEETGSMKGAFAALGSSLAGTGGLMIAFNLVGAAVALFSDKLFSSSKAADEAKKANEEFAKSLNDAKASALSTGIQLQTFINIAKDGSKPLSERNEALKEANKIMGEHGEKITLANVATKEITDQTKLFTQALIDQAVAAKYADKAADFIIKQTEASKEYGKALDDYNTKQAEANVLSKAASETGVGFEAAEQARHAASVAYDKLVQAATNYKNVRKDEIQTEIDANIVREKTTAALVKIGDKTTSVDLIMKGLGNTLEEIKKKQLATGAPFKTEQISAYKTAIDDLLKAGIAPTDAKIKELVAHVKALGGSFDEAKKSGKSIADINKEWQLALKALGIEETTEHADKFTEKINVLNNALQALVQKGLKETSKEIQNVKDQIVELTAEEALKTLPEQLKKGLKLAKPEADLPPIDIQIQPEVPSREEIGKQMAIITEAIKLSKLGFKLPKNFFTMSDDDREALTKQLEDIAEIVKNTVGDVFTTMAENLGNLKNPLAGIFDILGDGLIALGKQVIITSTLVASIKKALDAALSGFPGAGIAVGIGLIVAGSLLKHFKPFAEGGIVTGPTRALIGEAGPEVVFPLDRLREFISPAQSQVVVLETRVRGSDIWLSQSRTSERRGRTY